MKMILYVIKKAGKIKENHINIDTVELNSYIRGNLMHRIANNMN